MSYILVSTDWRENINNLLLIALDFEKNHEITICQIQGEETACVSPYGYTTSLHDWKEN